MSRGRWIFTLNNLSDGLPFTEIVLTKLLYQRQKYAYIF